MERNELMEVRKQMLSQMEQRLHESWSSEEDSMFYHHSSEDRIVLSHALFWVMTKSLIGSIAKERYFLLLRQYQEEMLDDYLTESEDFPDMLHYCNILYESLPMMLKGTRNLSTDTSARKLAATAIVAGGYGGDMPEELCDELLDDMDFLYNRVKCRKIEQMLPLLNQMVAEEMKGL